jgi:uncharacterized protein (TIGR03067 family)
VLADGAAGPANERERSAQYGGSIVMTKLLALLTASLLVVTPASFGDDGGKRVDDLTGVWKGGPVKTLTIHTDPELKGETANEYLDFVASVAAGEEFEFKDGKVSWVRTATDGKRRQQTWILDTSKSPKTVVAKLSDGKVVFQGIYKVDKGSLSLCLSVKMTPKEFKDAPPKSRLFEFKRVEKK